MKPDSIEDVNSTKDMTGVVTTYSDADSPKNPYFDLIPYVCPFLPDSITRGKLGMTQISNGFAGQHRLLNLCNMQNEAAPLGGARLSISVTLQATSFTDVFASPTHTNVATSVPIWRNVTGLVYKNAGDDDDRSDGTPRTRVCNMVWGTFYGTARVAVLAGFGYRVDPCRKVVEVAKLVAPYLPSKPIQMRPTEG
ncbi:hypothetical protein [Williamsia maris]|uniref:hypothetical protein n=1 Tax=Williamsia maris TaxID=72806 RepID=UPI0020A49B31|nr:hypothetical protein [Williamsia maris]